MKIMNPLRFKTYIPPVIKATNLYVTEENINLGEDNYILTYYLEPEDVDTKSIDWYYLPKDGNLIITALGDNRISIQRANTIQPNITYKLVLQTIDGSNLEDSVAIFIEDTTIYVNNITFSPSSLEIPLGGEGQFAFTVLPSDATNRDIELEVTNDTSGSTNGITISKESNIVTVQIANSAELGQYTITGTARDGSGISGSCSFTIVKASSSEEEIEEHRSTWRGTDLLSSGHFSSIDEIADAVAAGDFSDIWVGDYFTINGPVFNNSSILSYDEYNLVVMDINTVSSLSQPHLVLMPDHIIGVTDLLQSTKFNLYEVEEVSNMLRVYSQSLKVYLGENNLIDFIDRMPSDTSYSAIFPGITLPSARSITNSYSNVNPLSMSQMFTSILPGISLSSSGAGRPTLSSLTSYQAIAMYAISDLNNSNGFLIVVMNNGQLVSSGSLQNMSLGVCPLLVFG